MPPQCLEVVAHLRTHVVVLRKKVQVAPFERTIGLLDHAIGVLDPGAGAVGSESVRPECRVVVGRIVPGRHCAERKRLPRVGCRHFAESGPMEVTRPVAPSEPGAHVSRGFSG